MPDDQESAQNPTEPESASPPAQPEAAESSEAPAPNPADELAASALASAQAAIDSLNAETQDEPAEAAQQPAQQPTPQPTPEPMPASIPSSDVRSTQPTGFNFPDFSANAGQAIPKGMDLLSDVNVDVTIELGRTRMLVEDVLRLAEGAVVELDKLAGDPVDIYVNHRLVARGEVLVLNDSFCIRVNDILDADLVEQEA